MFVNRRLIMAPGFSEDIEKAQQEEGVTQQGQAAWDLPRIMSSCPGGCTSRKAAHGRELRSWPGFGMSHGKQKGQGGQGTAVP